MSHLTTLIERLASGDIVDRLIGDTLDDTRAAAERFIASPAGQDAKVAGLVTTAATVAYVAGRALWRHHSTRTTTGE